MQLIRTVFWLSGPSWLLAPLLLLSALPGCERAAMAPVSAGIGTDMAIVAAAAAEARQRCHAFMHEDADEYVGCIDTVLRRAETSKDGPEQLARQLGVVYFGWVGANNSARIALPGASVAAERYRRLLRTLQTRLAISDEKLCSAVPGDCRTRIAQLIEQEER